MSPKKQWVSNEKTLKRCLGHNMAILSSLESIFSCKYHWFHSEPPKLNGRVQIYCWRVFQKSNNYKITVLRYGCLCVFICLGAYWGQTKQNWRLLCKHQLKKISSLNSWCNLFLKKVLIINRYSCLKIKNVAFNSLMSNL